MLELNPIQLTVQVTLSADAPLLAALQSLTGTKPPTQEPAMPNAQENVLAGFSPVATMTPTIFVDQPATPVPAVFTEQNAAPFAPVPNTTIRVPQPQVVPMQQILQPQQPGAVPVGQPAAQTSAPPIVVTPPATPNPFTLDMLQTAAAELAARGKQTDIVQLLAEFGVPMLTALPQESFGAFATALRGKGAKI